MKGVFQGLGYLHSEKDIIHRDLKPGNILITDESNLDSCQLIDFGIATHNKKQNLKKYGNIGTLIYQPPEQVKNKNKYNYGKMADIWACGIIAYTLITGKHPFVDADDSTDYIKDKILSFQEIQFPDYVSSQARHLISTLCTPEQSNRYSALAALKHPWITRKLDSPPPLTQIELTAQLSYEMAIETKLRKAQSAALFLAVTRVRDELRREKLDATYIDRIRYYEQPEQQQQHLAVKQTKSRGSHNKRRMTMPELDLQKSSQLSSNGREAHQKIQFNVENLDDNIAQATLNTHDKVCLDQTSISGMNSEHDDQQESNEQSSQDITYNQNSINQGALSPDVKLFLRENRIRMRKGSKQRYQQHSDRNLKQSRGAKNDNAKIGPSAELLTVPKRGRRKTIFSNQSPGNNSGGSFSSKSPRELKMEISGNFSDFMSDRGSSASNKERQNVNQDDSRKPKAGQTSYKSNLPDIEEKKSIQAKNYQPKEILSRIKNQRVESKDIKFGGSYKQFGSLVSQNSLFDHKNQFHKKRRTSKFEQIDISQKPHNLIQYVQEQIKGEEEQIKNLMKHAQPSKHKTLKVKQTQPYRPSSSLGGVQNDFQSLQVTPQNSAGLVMIEFHGNFKSRSSMQNQNKGSTPQGSFSNKRAF